MKLNATTLNPNCRIGASRLRISPGKSNDCSTIPPTYLPTYLQYLLTHISCHPCITTPMKLTIQASVLALAALCTAQLQTLNDLPSCAVSPARSLRVSFTDTGNRNHAPVLYQANAISVSRAYARIKPSSLAFHAAYRQRALNLINKVGSYTSTVNTQMLNILFRDPSSCSTTL